MSNFKKIFETLNPEQQTAMEEHFLRIAENTKQRMRLVKEVRAGPMRLEAVEFEGAVTYTMCFDNDVMAHMGENAAKLFADFVTPTESYCIVGDDSGHEYVIPTDHTEKWNQLDFDSDDVPDWARRIDGRFSFTGPIFSA